jgi:sterol desaturase/sphingolipid hydroxylase (fatty acid hydroxylase superfamily)
MSAGPDKKRREAEWLNREVPVWLSGMLIAGTLAAVLWLEHKRPLRRQKENKLTRDARNAVMSVLSALAIGLTEKPITKRLASIVQKENKGMVKQLHLPPWLEVALAVILLDYTLYLWHVVTHELPSLWRLHRVHHADIDLSATTALRFHFVEMMLSAPWRGAQVLVVGASPFSLSAWQAITTAAILFHHSNVKLPIKVERVLCRVVMTPRMHGIHHSIIKQEINSNWSTIFSWPDYLHGTFRLNIPQQEITTGVPEFRKPEELTLKRLIRMPFGEQPPPWRFPDLTMPQREVVPAVPRSTLLA